MTPKLKQILQQLAKLVEQNNEKGIEELLSQQFYVDYPNSPGDKGANGNILDLIVQEEDTQALTQLITALKGKFAQFILQKNGVGSTLLHRLADLGTPRNLKFILDNVPYIADALSTKNIKGQVPLSLVIENTANIEILKQKIDILIEAGVGSTFFEEDLYKKTPLIKILEINDKELSKKLLNILLREEIVFPRNLKKYQPATVNLLSRVVVPPAKIQAIDISENLSELIQPNASSSATEIRHRIFKLLQLEEAGYIVINPDKKILLQRMFLLNLSKELIQTPNGTTLTNEQMDQLDQILYWLNEVNKNPIEDPYKKITIKHLIDLVTFIKRRFSKTQENLPQEKLTTILPEALLLQAYEAYSDPAAYEDAMEPYFVAFDEANRKIQEITHLPEYKLNFLEYKLDLELLSDIEQSAIKQLQMLEKSFAPGKEKTLVSFALMKCYYKQKNYEAARKQIEAINRSDLDTYKQSELQKIAGDVYYQLAMQANNEKDKETMLQKAYEENHGIAAIILAGLKIDSAKTPEQYNLVAHILEIGLQNAKSADINKLKEVFPSAIIYKLLRQKDLGREPLRLLFQKILNDNLVTAENWSTYKTFLQVLAKDISLLLEDRLNTELVLFTCYSKGLAVEPEELGISKTKKGIFGRQNEKKPQEIEAEKKDIINKKLKTLREEIQKLEPQQVKTDEVKQTQTAEATNLYPKLDVNNNNNNLETQTPQPTLTTSTQVITKKLTAVNTEQKRPQLKRSVAQQKLVFPQVPTDEVPQFPEVPKDEPSYATKKQPVALTAATPVAHKQKQEAQYPFLHDDLKETNNTPENTTTPATNYPGLNSQIYNQQQFEAVTTFFKPEPEQVANKENQNSEKDAKEQKIQELTAKSEKQEAEIQRLTEQLKKLQAAKSNNEEQDSDSSTLTSTPTLG